jgi:superfamily II DNA or RNA helicase
MFTLRDYQVHLVNRAQEQLRIGGVPCIVAPTGAGKTVLLAELARLALERGERVVTVAHRQEIVLQIVKSLRGHLGTRVGIEVVTAGSTARWNRPVTVGMVPTMARRLKHLPALKGCTLLQDECHHAGAASWARVTEALAPGRRAGLTATPVRPNGNGLGDEGGFTSLVIGPHPDELMAMGALCRYRLFAAPTTIDSRGLRKRGGDYATADLERKVVEINGQIVPDFLRFNPERLSTIAVAVSVAHAHQLAELYREAGISAQAVDGETPAAQRNRIFADFRSGAITVLVACAVIDEGLDVPEATVLQVTRPTASLRLWKQLCGRVLRPAEGKAHAILLDHTDNWRRLPLPDARIEWELNPERQAQAERRQLEVNPITQEIVVGPPLEVESTGAQLQEITPELIAKAKPQQARRMFNLRFLQEAQQVAGGEMDRDLLKPWLTRVAVLEPDNLRMLGRLLELAPGWAEAQLMLNGALPAQRAMATRAAQAALLQHP